MSAGFEPSSPRKTDGRVRDGDAGGRSQASNTTVIPVTVKMCMEAKKEIPQSVFSIDGQDISMVCHTILYFNI